MVPDDIRFHQGMGLTGALERFSLTLAVMQTPAAVARITAELCEDAVQDGVTTLEIRFGPHLHTRHGASLDDIVDAAIDGASGRAGIILCGLYGDPPELFERFIDLARSRPRVVGLDLAGGPESGATWGLSDYAEAFARAAELGIGRTVHAGEGRPAHEIRAAIETLHAVRIGHGTTLCHDPAIVDLVLERGVVIEACLTSNTHTGAIASIADHPLPLWLARGIKATICTDNTLFSDTLASEEHRRAAAIPGMTAAMLKTAIENAHQAAFRR